MTIDAMVKGYDADTTALENLTRQEWRSRHSRIVLKKTLQLLIPLPGRLTVPTCRLVEILVTYTSSPHRHTGASCDVALHLINDRGQRITLNYTTRPFHDVGVRNMTELPDVVQAMLRYEPNWLLGA